MSCTPRLAFDIVSRQSLPHIRTRCGTCTNDLVLAARNREPHEHTAKRIRGEGWLFDLWNRRAARCPTCQASEAAERKGESGKKDVEILGNVVALPSALLPGSIKPPSPPRPARQFVCVLRSRKSLEELQSQLGKVAEILALKMPGEEPATPPPELPYHHDTNHKKAGAQRAARFRVAVHEQISTALAKFPAASDDAVARYFNRIGFRPYGKAKTWTADNIAQHMRPFRNGSVVVVGAAAD